jgi:hypothetical protein
MAKNDGMRPVTREDFQIFQMRDGLFYVQDLSDLCIGLAPDPDDDAPPFKTWEEADRWINRTLLGGRTNVPSGMTTTSASEHPGRLLTREQARKEGWFQPEAKNGKATRAGK